MAVVHEHVTNTQPQRHHQEEQENQYIILQIDIRYLILSRPDHI
jgi:hypothetical protein